MEFSKDGSGDQWILRYRTSFEPNSMYPCEVAQSLPVLVEFQWIGDELQRFRVVDVPRCVSSESKIVNV